MDLTIDSIPLAKERMDNRIITGVISGYYVVETVRMRYGAPMIIAAITNDRS
jgi:hypothetical protein